MNVLHQGERRDVIRRDVIRRHVIRRHVIPGVLLSCFACVIAAWLLGGLEIVGPEIVGPVKPRSSPATADPLQEQITPIPLLPSANRDKTALGAALFEDPRLFGGNHVACVTCHDIHSNGASNRRFDAVSGVRLPVNTPTLFNAALNFRLNWAGDQPALEAQAVGALQVHGPIANNPAQAAMRLNQEPDVKAGFQKTYGHPADGPSLLDAIATYERSLLTPGSRFDRWLAGDRSALSDQELEGYRTFKSMGCVACHQGVGVGGNLFEQSGVFRPLTESGPIRVRVPSLRNVATTAPYFHDGSAPTLADAVRRMASAQLNRTLTDNQIRSIVSFLDTLTGEYRGVAVRAPAP